MRVHFICRGNAFRSRLAEAYLNSLHLSNVTAVSSGTVAKDNAAMNGDMPFYTEHALSNHGLLLVAKPSWDQLTQQRLKDDDYAVFMNQLAYEEAKSNQLVPSNYEIWDIPDIGEKHEGVLTPTRDDPAINDFAEATFNRIATNVDTLLRDKK